MSKHDINKAYISPYDKFFHDFDKAHAPSLSQMAEKNLFAVISRLRDYAQSKKSDEDIWQEF